MSDVMMEDEVQTMRLFSCHVRPGGNMLHSVPYENITDRELRMLKSIHGSDCVVNLSRAGEKEVNVREHLLELALKYKRERVERVFQVSLDDFNDWLERRQYTMEAQRENEREAREQALRQQPVTPDAPVVPPVIAKPAAARAAATME